MNIPHFPRISLSLTAALLENAPGCVLWMACCKHFPFLSSLVVWAVDGRWGPRGGGLCALLPVLVCPRQPAVLVLPAAEEHGLWSQRSCRWPYWKMWVSVQNPWKQIGVWVWLCVCSLLSTSCIEQSVCGFHFIITNQICSRVVIFFLRWNSVACLFAQFPVWMK